MNAASLASLAKRTRQRFLKSLSAHEADYLLSEWSFWARDEQRPPGAGHARDWTTWLFLGGRGAGKTRAGAEWVRGLIAASKEPLRVALIGETYGDVRRVMIEGHSGLLSVAREGERPALHDGRRELGYPGGSIVQFFSAEDPEGLRGPQFHCAWADELAKWRYPDETWRMLQLSLRLGERPRQAVTTTPRPIRLLKEIMADPMTHITHACTTANRHNLAPAFLGEIVRRYEGTSLGRQELGGELIEDRSGALFSRQMIDEARTGTAPALERIVVAVDPPVSVGPDADECGIIVAGAAGEPVEVFVLSDFSVQGRTPSGWAARVVEAAHAFGADMIIAETNQGGALIETLLAQIDPRLVVRPVHAMRAKAARAEPVAALYEQGRVHHVGMFPQLEDQLTAFTGRSRAEASDRVDALVWAVSALALGEAARSPRLRRL